MNRPPPLSDRARQKYVAERTAFEEERFDAGYATGVRLLEQGVVPWRQIECIGTYMDQVGLEPEDLNAQKLYEYVTGDVNNRYQRRQEWLNRYLGTAWPHAAMVHGIHSAIMDAWKQIEGQERK